MISPRGSILLLTLAAVPVAATHALPRHKTPAKPLTISVQQPAYAGEPIWVQIVLPRHGAPIPVDAFHTARCDQLELRYDGKPVARRLLDKAANGVFGIIMGSTPYDPMKAKCFPNRITNLPGNRVSLQAQYVVNQPGEYEVRLVTAWPGCVPGTIGPKSVTMYATSSWVTFEVLPTTPAQRRAWLARLVGHPPADVASLRGDYLPSLVAAAPDPRALAAVAKQLPSSNPYVAVEALHALAYFPKESGERAFLDSIQRFGPNELLAQVASENIYGLNADLAAREKMVRASFPYLTSSDPAKSAGAVLMLLYECHLPMKLRLDAALVALADRKVLEAAPAIIAARHEDAMRTLSRYLGLYGGSKAHSLLWEIADAGGSARDQALEAIMYHPEPSDLPKMEAVFLQPGGGQFMPSDIPKVFLKDFGDRAVPVLQRLMKESPYLWVRITSAQQLLPRNDPAALRFFIEAIGLYRWPYSSVPRWDWIQLVQKAYPKELPANANQKQVLALLRARLFATERKRK
jgi:hypothetical protein